MRLFLCLILAALITSTALAEPDLTATGHDWLQYSPEEKAELMNAIYDTLEVDRNEHTVDKGVVALFVFYTSFYEQVQEECRPELAEALMDKCLKVPCIKIVKDTVLEKEGE